MIAYSLMAPTNAVIPAMFLTSDRTPMGSPDRCNDIFASTLKFPSKN